MVDSSASVMTEKEADLILHNATGRLRTLFEIADICNPLIVYRNNRIMLSYYQTPQKMAADIRTLAKLQGKLQSVLNWEENHARFKLSELTGLLTVASSEQQYTLTLYKGGSDNTEAQLVLAYSLDLRNYRGNSNASASCMNHIQKPGLRHKNYNGQAVYPCMAYNHPSLALAVLINESGAIVARSIVNLKHNRFYSSYSESYDIADILPAQLEAAGFSQDGDALEDCYLVTVLNDDGSPLMPYLDGNYDNADYNENPDYLTDGEPVKIIYSGAFCCDHSTGTPENYGNDRIICDDCNEVITDSDEVNHINDQIVCDCCRDSHYTYAYVRRYQEYVNNNEHSIYEHNGECYTEDSLEYHNLVILQNGDIADSDDVVIDSDGDAWHIDDCEQCAVTGEYCAPSDITMVCRLPFSPDALADHTTDGRIDLITDRKYPTDPTFEDALELITELCHSDYTTSTRQDRAILDAMIAQYILDKGTCNTIEQLPLLLTA